MISPMAIRAQPIEKNESFPEPRSALPISEKSSFQKPIINGRLYQRHPKSRLIAKATHEAWHTYGLIGGFLKNPPPQKKITSESRIFGEVFQCKWGEETIAVKKIKDSEVAVTEVLAMKALEGFPGAVKPLFSFRAQQNDFWIGLPFYPETMVNVSNIRERNSLKLAIQITTQLATLHKNGWCYNDLKVDNICLDAEGNAKIIDFGLSGNLKRPQKFFGGTARWLSPETLSGHPNNQYSDLWSLGLVLYTLYSDLLLLTEYDENNGTGLFNPLENGIVPWHLFQIMALIGWPNENQKHRFNYKLETNPFLNIYTLPPPLLDKYLTEEYPIPKPIANLIKRLVSYDNRPSAEETLSILTDPNFMLSADNVYPR